MDLGCSLDDNCQSRGFGIREGTPVCFAAVGGHLDCLRILLDARVDIKTTSACGFGRGNVRKTPLELAEDGGHTHCADLIKSYATIRPTKSAAKVRAAAN